MSQASAPALSLDPGGILGARAKLLHDQALSDADRARLLHDEMPAARPLTDAEVAAQYGRPRTQAAPPPPRPQPPPQPAAAPTWPLWLGIGSSVAALLITVLAIASRRAPETPPPRKPPWP